MTMYAGLPRAYNEPVTKYFPEFEKSEFAVKTMGEVCVWMRCRCEGVELSSEQIKLEAKVKYSDKSQLFMKQEFEYLYFMLGK